MRLLTSLMRNVAASSMWLVHQEERELERHRPRWLLTTLTMVGVFALTPLLFTDLYIFPIAFTAMGAAMLWRLLIFINMRRKLGPRTPARDGAIGPPDDHEAKSIAHRESRSDNAD